MTPQEARAKLVDVISRSYSRDELDEVVFKALNNRLAFYVGEASLLTMVDKFIGELELTPDTLADFLAVLSTWTRKPEVRAAINDYLEIPAGEDPYDALMVLDEPFVNRQISRDKLRELFQTPNRRAMVVRGIRASGKSYSRWLIEHLARTEGIEPVFVELRDNAIEDVVGQIINDLSLPPTEFRDRLAQASTMTKGFISALRGSARKMKEGEHWCLIFDSHDYDTVPQAMRTFVDDLLAEVANLQMLPIWMVVLGHRPLPPVPGVPAQLRKPPIIDDILQLSAPDVEKYLQQFSAQRGVALAVNPSDLSEEIFQGLNPPLDHEGMQTVAVRLREKIAQIGGG